MTEPLLLEDFDFDQEISIEPVPENPLIQVATPVSPSIELKTVQHRPIESIVAHMGNFKKQAEMTKALFPGPEGLYLRMLTYTYLHGIWAYHKPEIDPRYFGVNFIGEPGVGKSARVRAWGQALGVEIVKRSLQGVSDFESVLGITHIDPETKETVLYPPRSLPKPHEHDRYCMVFLDDFNRGESHCVAGGMEFANTGAYNDYKLPQYAGVCAAMNPSGVGNKVKSLDAAQISRFFSIVMPHRPEDFLNQLLLQGAPMMLVNYHNKFKHEIVSKHPYVMPDDREINDRNRMGHALFCNWAIHDEPVLFEASNAIYGPTFMSKLETVKSGDFPLEPYEILNGDIEEIREKVKSLVARRKQDVLMLSMTMLCYHLNDKKTVLARDQIDNLCEYFLSPQPDGISLAGLRKLVQKSAPRAKDYREILMLWKAKDRTSMGPLGAHFVRMTNQTKLEAQESRKAYLEAQDLQIA